MSHTQSDSARYTEAIAKHDAFFFIEYPMRMAAIHAGIAITNAKIELAAVKRLAEDAENTAKFYRKLYNL